MLNRSLTALVVALTLMLPRVAPSQNETFPQELLVPPSQIDAATIAVVAFNAAPGSESLEGRVFQRVIERNLEISGWFQPNKERQLVAAQDASDRQGGTIQFAEWRRLGVDYLVKGTYSLNGSMVDFDVEVYDVLAGARATSVSDQNDSARSRPFRDPVNAAHAISDAIVQNLTGETGIAQTKILYITQTRRGRELALMDCDGGRIQMLTEDNATVMAACWGANNQEVYMTSTARYNPDLLGMFVDGSQRWVISEAPGLNLSPAWNPLTQRISMTLSRDGNSEIYTVDRNGSNPLRLTTNRAIDSSPCWTPDGRSMLFTSDRDGGRPQLWVMDRDGRGQRRLTTRDGYRYNDGANISPDGRRVVFTSKVGGQFDIFVMDIDGDSDSWVRLTDHSSDDEDPCWTRDGQHVVFSSTRSGQRQIHIMNADGSNVHQLTTRGINLSPMAEPLLN